MKKAERINCHIFQMWLEGRGRQPANWETLVTVLEDIEKSSLANKIKEYVLTITMIKLFHDIFFIGLSQSKAFAQWRITSSLVLATYAQYQAKAKPQGISNGLPGQHLRTYDTEDQKRLEIDRET